MHDAFAVHMLTEGGKASAREIATAFDELLAKLNALAPDGREMAVVRTKLEEACFFAKKAMAKSNCLPSP